MIQFNGLVIQCWLLERLAVQLALPVLLAPQRRLHFQQRQRSRCRDEAPVGDGDGDGDGEMYCGIIVITI